MEKKTISRRELAAAAVAIPVALSAQAPATESPEALLEQARQGVRRNRELLAKVKVSMAAEPAFQFKA